MNVDQQAEFSGLLNNVPAVTLFFWVIKVMATTVGETAAGFINVNLGLGLSKTSMIMGVLLIVALVVQLAAQGYVPWKYWLVVVPLSIFGTLITDNLVDNFRGALATTTAVFSVALALTFIGWYASEKTLSIHSIFTRKRELWYWTTILFTFALGTAAGDLLAEGLKLGYAFSALLFVVVIAAVAFANLKFGMNAVWAFWIAYVLMRPFGASCGDLLAQPLAKGGLGLGTVGTSALFLTVILGLVVYLTISRKDVIRGDQRI